MKIELDAVEIANQQSAIDELAERMLKDEGKVLIATPGFCAIFLLPDNGRDDVVAQGRD